MHSKSYVYVNEGIQKGHLRETNWVNDFLISQTIFGRGPHGGQMVG